MTSCASRWLSQLSAIIEGCQHYIPKLSADVLCSTEDGGVIKRLLGQPYAPLSLNFDDKFYQRYTIRLKQLLALQNHLTPLHTLQRNVFLALKMHDAIPANSGLLTTFQNMHCLQEEVVYMKNLTETTFCEILDRYPSRTEVQLRSMVKQVSTVIFHECFLIDGSLIWEIGDNQKLLEGKLPNISFLNFKTLGARQWLDDEIINYFVNKWCSKSSTTLGLSTFFACKVLFEDADNSCVHAKQGILTGEDDNRALRWCRRAEVSYGHLHHSRTVVLNFTRGV